MRKPDDSSLSDEQYESVRRAAIALLHKGDAWGQLPTPIPILMEATQLKIAPINAFDHGVIERFARQAGQVTTKFLKAAIEKVWGIFDVQANVVHIDESAGNEEKINFLKLHEAGHKEIPHQRGLFKWIQDCSKTLSPEVADLFDREANNFASIVLFQDDTFANMTADSAFGIKVPISAARKFKASVYASMREYVRRNAKACAVIVLNPTEVCPVNGFSSGVRRIEYSPEFMRRFGELTSGETVTPTSPFGKFIPFGKKRMSSPSTIILTDRNGDRHEFVGEGFSTGWNVFILLHANSTLKKSIFLTAVGG